jgi:nucleoside phosphorylase
MKTAILTPLRAELSILLSELEKLNLKTNKLKLNNLEVFEFPELKLLVAHGGHGKTQFAIHSQYLMCCIPSIELLVSSGVAGALSQKLNIGDIVVATEIIEHDFKLKLANRPLPKFSSHKETINSLRDLSKSNSEFILHFGSIASGDEDIISESRKKELLDSTSCIAVAWEGAGGARVCEFNNKKYIELRAISDTADCNSTVEFEINLKPAMTNLAKMIIQWQNSLKQI